MEEKKPKKWKKRLKRFALWFSVFLLLLVGFTYAVFKSPAFQTYLVKEFTDYLNKDLKSKISIEGVDVKPFDNALALKGFLVLDYKGDTLLYLKELTFNVDQFGLEKRFVDAHLLKVNQGLLDIKQYKGDTINTLAFFLDELSGNEKDTTPKTPWNITSRKLELKKFEFRFNNENEAKRDSGIDYAHIRMRNMSGEINQLKYDGDTLTAEIKEAKGKEQSGFVLNKFSSKLKFNGKELLLDKFWFSFNSSQIKGTVRLRYDGLSDFGDVINKVRIKTIISSSDLLMKDLGYFAPSLLQWNQRISMKGEIRGKISSLKLKDVFVEAGNNTFLNGAIELEGLPDFENTFVFATLNEVRSDYADLTTLTYPSGEGIQTIPVPEMVQKLGTIKFRGEYTGFIKEFVANGSINTALGYVRANVKLSVGANKTQTLDGDINVPNFELGRLLSNATLGSIVLKGNTRVVINEKKTTAFFDGQIPRVDFNEYTYKNITLNANVSDKLFKGSVSIADKNLDMEFDGEVNANKDSLNYDFTAHVRKANLSKLSLIDRDTSLCVSAFAKFNLKGNSIDQIKGKAFLDSVRWKEGLYDEKIGKIIFLTDVGKRGRSITLSSSIADAAVSGHFSIEHLSDLMAGYFQHYLGNVLTEKYIVEKNQNINFNFKIDDYRPIQRLFTPEIFLSKHTEALFSFSNEEGAKLQMYSDTCSFPGVSAKEFMVMANPVNDQYYFNATATKIYPANKVPLQKFDFTSYMKNNLVQLDCDWNNDDSLKNNAHIGADVSFEPKGAIAASLNDTKFYLQDKLWTLNADNQLFWNNNLGEVKNLRLSMDDKSLLVNGWLGETDKEVLNLSFNGISLEFLKVILPEVKVTGNVDGEVEVAAILKHPKVTSSLVVNDLFVNDQKFGQTDLTTAYISDEQKITIDLKVKKVTGNTEDGGYLLKMDGDYYPFREKDQLDCEIDFKNFRIALLQPYFEGVLSGIGKAKVYGTLDVTGELESPSVIGELQFKDFSPTIDYLNVAYDLNDKVYFREDGIYFENFAMKATAPYYSATKEEGVGMINGVITHNRFHDISFNIGITAKKLIALNTNLDNNINYYGRAFVSGDIMVGGTPANIIMYANLKTEKFDRGLSSSDHTLLVLPLDQQSELPMYDFVEFVNPKDTTTKKVTVSNVVDVPWLDMSLDITVTPDAKVKMIFDSRVGDEITAQGNADMQFQINSNGKFTMNGKYEVDKGEYFFTVKNFLGKKFKVSQGGTVQWNGDPMEAEVDLKAMYVVRSNLSSLIEPGLTESQIKDYNTTIPIKVVLYMSGNLWSPQTSLDIEVDDMNLYAKKAIAKAIVSETDKTKQALSLLMQGSLLPPQSGFGGGDVLNAGLANAKQFLTGQVNNYLAQLTGEALNVGFDYNGRSDSSSTVSMTVNKNLFHDKVVVSGTFDLGKDASDMEIQYKVTNNIILKAFRKSQQEQKNQDATFSTQGASIFFRKEFDTLKELFSREKKQ